MKHWDNLVIEREFTITGRGLILAINLIENNLSDSELISREDDIPFNDGDTLDYNSNKYKIKSIEFARDFNSKIFAKSIALIVEKVQDIEENLFTPRCIRTHSGKYVNVFELTPEMFRIEDVIYSLAKEPRFGGHLNDEDLYDDERQYSVLQHVLHCVELISEEDKFAILNHENGEAFLRDLAKPIKMEIPQYNEIEDKLLADIAPIIGFQYPFTEEVHSVDKKMLWFEWNVFMLKREPSPDTVPQSQKEHFEQHGKYYIMKKKEAREKFMQLFAKYKPQ